MTDLIVTSVADGEATLTLNRPGAINSLNLEMLSKTTEILDSWAHDDSIREVVLRGNGTRGFCAGADVRELSQVIQEGGPWLRFLETEYLLDMMVAQYPKHITAHLHGITMGGGLGLTVGADRRIVDSTSLLAMPETKIGFFPDAGVMRWPSAWPTSPPTVTCQPRCPRPPGSRSVTWATTRSRSYDALRSIPTRPRSRRDVRSGRVLPSQCWLRCGLSDARPSWSCTASSIRTCGWQTG